MCAVLTSIKNEDKPKVKQANPLGNLGTRCQNTMAEHVQESANNPPAVHRENLHYLLHRLAGLSESNAHKPVENIPISDEQVKVSSRGL
jgi:hypothetical protein